MSMTKLRRRRSGLYGIGRADRFVAFFFDAATDRFSAYSYAGGSQGALLAQKDIAGFGSFVGKAVIGHSPLVVAMQGGGGLYVWNVAANTVAAISTHPVVGSAWTQICSGADGYAYWIERPYPIAEEFDEAHLWRVDAAGFVSECVQAGGNAIAGAGDFTFMSQSAFCDGSLCFAPFGFGVGGSVCGILQLAITGGDTPHVRTDTDWLPGDALDWPGWQFGHRIPGQPRAIGKQYDFQTYQVLRIGALHGQAGGDQTLFGYEPLVDPFNEPLLDLSPTANGSRFALTSLDGSTGLVALVSTAGPTDAGDIEFYALDAGPGPGYPFFVVPV